MKAKKRDTSQKRESILNAAIKAFGDLGYDNTSMDYIAEKATASKRTVYNHFQSKDDLFQAVIDRFTMEMHFLKQIRYDSSRGLAEQLGDFADAELALTNNPTWMGFIKVLLIVFIRDPKMALKSMAKYSNSEDTLVTWLKEAAQDGKLIIENPQLSAKVFWSMLGGAFTWPAVYQGYLDPKLAQALKTELIKTFLSRYQFSSSNR
jgi:TetR/AcrR family transcriptional regulator, regulator of autoinduction and epiphytic fitness